MGVGGGCGSCGRHRRAMPEATTTMTMTTTMLTGVPGTTTQNHYFSTYAEDKVAAKEMRRQQFEQRLARVEQLKTRRDGRPTEVKKTEFKSWYDKRRTYHEIMDRKARQEGLPWKIQVAAVVERLPLILPVREKWEQDYVDLKKHLNQFTWDYPNELARLDKMTEESDELEGECVCL
jgi:NAD(P)H-dependent flavin oxidoreductase YrpB (nitropropane dioxygenase family)